MDNKLLKRFNIIIWMRLVDKRPDATSLKLPKRFVPRNASDLISDNGLELAKLRSRGGRLQAAEAGLRPGGDPTSGDDQVHVRREPDGGRVGADSCASETITKRIYRAPKKGLSILLSMNQGRAGQNR